MCCDGDQCAHEFLRCDKTSGSIFGTCFLLCNGFVTCLDFTSRERESVNHKTGLAAESICVRCGGEAEQCCVDSNQVQYCAGSNMRCDGGMYPRPCPNGFIFSRPRVIARTHEDGIFLCRCMRYGPRTLRPEPEGLLCKHGNWLQLLCGAYREVSLRHCRRAR
jgi:hypothetical protein